MTQKTAFGDAEVTTLMKVERAKGGVQFFKVADDVTTEIDEATYLAEGGQ